MTERKVSSERVSALLPVDGLEVVAHAYVVEGECEQIEWGSGVLLPDDPSLVQLTPLSQASSVIAGLKDANEALMRERTSLIETKREQIERINRECTETLLAATEADDITIGHLNSRISSLEEENKRLRAVVSASAEALGNGAFISTEASVEFMELLPVEIKAFLSRIGDHNG